MSPLSRLQRLAVETRDRDLLIAAGAGSGKTRVLVERVLGCLADGIPLERILVVTFTEKAAMEMKNRIYRTLSESPQLAHLRLQLPQARISTIHAFCARLLREQFERAGVDPRFRILSEEDATLLLEEAVTRVFEDGYRGSWGEEATETFARLVEMCGYDEEGERLRKVVRRLLEYARASDDPARFLDQHLERMGRHGAWDDLPWREDYARRAALAWRTATGLLRMLAGRATANDPKNRPFAELARALEAIDPERLGDPAGQHEALAALERAGVIARDAEGASFSIDLPTLRRSPELGKLRQVVKEALGNVYLAAMPLDTVELLAEEGQSAHYARALVHLTQRVHAAYEEAKGRTGRLDYSDLEIRTLALLEGSPAGEAEEKPVGFDRVFVDEFQDVNGLQHRILSRLCDPAGVFRVGDVKQSIYQFRLADPSIFRALGQSRAWVEDPEHPPREEPAWTVPLPENFRSLVPVLQAVNRISERIFLDEEIGGSYERERLEPGGKAEASPPPGAPVELLLVRPPANGDDAEAEAKGEAKAKAETEVEGEADAEAGAKAEMEAEAKPSCGGEDDAANAVERLGDGATGFVDPIEAEARAIARRLREILDSGETVRDPESGAPRRAAFGDIAILVRVRADAPPIGRILEEHGIP
ncbi:MAG: UvrD-helicase domain-containing protein, partial [Candidatus Eisenbacteria bacterium]|nr:UvrD-helicase domain-containing protein [Candidatus Eisenbacteria bacterium]